MNIFDQFDAIVVINLPHRTDRRREMESELRKVGVSLDHVSFFDAVQSSEKGAFYSAGARGCYLSHMTVLKEAKDSVLILEDDCDFMPFASSHRAPECGIYFAGYGVVTPDHVEGAHMIGYSAEAAKKAATFLDEIKDQGIPFDGALHHFLKHHPEVDFACASPSIAYQRSSQTNIGEARWSERVPFITLLRKAKRGLDKLRNMEIEEQAF